MSTIISARNPACGYTIFISKDGTVYSFGSHNKGAHGHKDEEVLFPKIISPLKNITSIDCGHEHTVCLDSSGCLFSFGSNNYGQLGQSNVKTTHVPLKVDIPPITQISCGLYFTICLSENGYLYSFGSNYNGQLGIGNDNIKSFNSPQKIESLKDIDFFECSDHTVCKTLNNEIYVWGSNEEDQLGIGNKKITDNIYYCSIPIKCEDWPNDIIDIKCGLHHTLVLTSSQDVYSCGSNEYGQLGQSSTFSHTLLKVGDISGIIIKIQCGYNHSMCIDINNDLYIFGENVFGQLGLKNTDTDGIYEPMKHPSLSNIIDISSGGWSTFVKTSNNEIYAFGDNEFSQLGIDTQGFEQFTPIRVFEDNEDIWYSNIPKSKAKSARSILPRPSNGDDNSPQKKKQKTN